MAGNAYFQRSLKKKNKVTGRCPIVVVPVIPGEKQQAYERIHVIVPAAELRL
jgi:hypothetical protein